MGRKTKCLLRFVGTQPEGLCALQPRSAIRGVVTLGLSVVSSHNFRCLVLTRAEFCRSTTPCKGAVIFGDVQPWMSLFGFELCRVEFRVLPSITPMLLPHVGKTHIRRWRNH